MFDVGIGSFDEGIGLGMGWFPVDTFEVDFTIGAIDESVDLIVSEFSISCPKPYNAKDDIQLAKLPTVSTKKPVPTSASPP